MANPGTSTYPGTLDAFTTVGTGTYEDATGYEHDLLHNQCQDADEKIETTIGTTAGTNVLKDFSAGDFPARVNSGGTIVQTLIGGTINSSTLGTPTINAGVFTGGGALSSKIIVGTRDLTGTSGDVSYTGVGFQPTSLIAFGGVDNTTQFFMGVADSGSAEYMMHKITAGNWRHDAALLGVVTISAGNEQTLVLKTFDADGFTLTWAKTGTPTGNANLRFLCFR